MHALLAAALAVQIPLSQMDSPSSPTRRWGACWYASKRRRPRASEIYPASPTKTSSSPATTTVSTASSTTGRRGGRLATGRGRGAPRGARIQETVADLSHRRHVRGRPLRENGSALRSRLLHARAHPGHGARRGKDLEAAALRWPPSLEETARDRSTDGRGTGQGAHGRHHSSQPEAGEPHVVGGRLREDPGLRASTPGLRRASTRGI